MTTPVRIRALPPMVADAIAAGEVIERPASVAKELCENALDAGARRIEVESSGGGLVRLCVSDDGSGIEADDLPLAVARHATSKIATTADLAGVATLGFRGEALASMAAVSDLRITSRVADAAAAATVRVRGGETMVHGPAAGGVGTVVEVCELFSTTPARLRFLRSARAEGAAVVRAVSELALARPEVAFLCRSEGRVAVRSLGGSLRDAAHALLGRGEAAALLEVDDGREGIAVSGLISPPGRHRGTRSALVLVVNGRRIHNRALMFAIEETYRGSIPSGRHPFGVVRIAIDPEAMDVNVHPSKREVRFRNEREVFAAVQRACWAAIGGIREPALVLGLPGSGAGRGWPDEGAPVTRPARADPPRREWSLADALDGAEDQHRAALSWGHGPGGDRGGTPPRPSAAEVSAALALHLPSADLEPGRLRLQALGQAGTEWLVASRGGGVVLVDPHAAHEKILYAELIESWRAGGEPAVQLLLVPAIIDCDPVRMERFATHAEAVCRCGIAVEEFGPSTLRCTAVPASCAGADAGAMVAELLDGFGDGDEAAGDREHRLAATMACHAAVRFGDPLRPDAQQALLDRLVRTPGGMTCPHGRPTMLSLDGAALRRAFRRPIE